MDAFDKYRAKVCINTAGELSDMRMIAGAVGFATGACNSTHETVKKITLYGNKIIGVTLHHHIMNHDYMFEKMVRYNKTERVFESIDDNYRHTIRTLEATDIDAKALHDFMVQNHIASVMSSSFDDLPGLYHTQVSCMGMACEVYVYCADAFMADTIPEKYQKLVKDSFEQLHAIRKRAGKNATKRSMDELKPITDANVLRLIF